jgi:hypothetical protein
MNILNTDSSLLPMANIKKVNAVGIGIYKEQSKITAAASVQTTLSIEPSNRYTLYDRYYLKLLDVASYVGGLFPGILALFFFMNAFGEYFSTIAFGLFRCNEAQSHEFLQYIKKMAYSLLTAVGCKLKGWKLAKKQA